MGLKSGLYGFNYGYLTGNQGKKKGFNFGSSNSAPSNPPLSNMLAWWKANSGVTANASNQVGSWADQSGNSNTVSNATDANKPIFVDGAQNGLPALRFTAASQHVLAHTTTPPICTALAGEDTPFSLYVAAKNNSLGALRTYFSVGQNATGGFHSLDITAGNLSQIRRNSVTDSTLSATGALTTTTYLFSMSFAGTTVTLRRNGAVTSINGTAQDVNTIALTRLAIGCLIRNSATQFLDGDIYEVIVYSGAHSATQAAEVEAYLNGKWALY